MGRTIPGSLLAVALLVGFPRPVSEHHLPPPAPQLRIPPDTIATNLDDYIWPTEASRRITSLFSEYRRTHFHGGIDVGTRRTTGYKVFAARSGYISRIMVSPTGYGKMLWIKHDDGYYTTYAHLKGFHKEIEELVRREQIRLKRYPVLIECSPIDFPVTKGDVIAYTGDTGTGSAHLHFEIRDPDKDFINPLLCKQLRYADDLPPVFRALAVQPIGERSIINGGQSPEVYRFKNDSQPDITLDKPIFASGRFGFAIYARDRANGQEFTTGVYSYRLFLNDSLLYEVKFDRTPSADDNQVGLHYDYYLMEDQSGRFEKLYMDSPNRLPFYKPRSFAAGILDTENFSPGLYRLKIETADIYGNTATLTGTLIASPPPDIHVGRVDNDITFSTDESGGVVSAKLFVMNLAARKPVWNEQALLKAASPLPARYPISNLRGRADVLKVVAYDVHGTPSLPRFVSLNPAAEYRSHTNVQHTITADDVRLTIRTAGVFTSLPSVALMEGEFSRKLAVIPVEYNEVAAVFRPLETVAGRRTLMIECEVNGTIQLIRHEIDLFPLVPGKAQRYSFDNGNLTIESEANSVFKPVFMEVETVSGERGIIYSLSPRHTVLNKGIRVTVRSAGEYSGLFYQGRGSGMRLLTAEERDGKFSSSITRSFGDLGVLIDSRPPEVSRLVTPRTPLGKISFRVSDNLSGVEYKELKLYINDIPVIPEIDGEHRRVVYQLEEPLKRGTHSLTILLKDRMGNTSEVRRTFGVR